MITRAFSVFALTVLGFGQLQSQPLDVTGWHGAVWGMTPGQTATAVGPQIVLEPAPGQCGDAATESLKAHDRIDTGNGTVAVELCFIGEPATLEKVKLDFGENPPAFSTIRDELKAKYGAPTSEDHQRLAGGNVLIDTAKWVLPKTEILCIFDDLTDIRTRKRTIHLGVYYLRHRANVL